MTLQYNGHMSGKLLRRSKCLGVSTHCISQLVIQLTQLAMCVVRQCGGGAVFFQRMLDTMYPAGQLSG